MYFFNLTFNILVKNVKCMQVPIDGNGNGIYNFTYM